MSKANIKLFWSAMAAILLSPAIGLAQTDTAQRVVPGRQNGKAQEQAPYVIMISADGFRYDYMDRYQAEHLQQLSASGARADGMIPGYPSVTFPNHYTLITGLYPAHHGLVNNTFFDPKKNTNYSMGQKDKVRDSSFYGGTPLWVLAEQQHLLSASLFWVGSEAAIKGVRPTYYYQYDESIPMSRRIEIVKEWLLLPAAKRPHFINFYLSEPDHAGHRYGPESPETAKAVKMVDSVINELTIAVKSTGLPVNFVFVADHGMSAVDAEHPLALPAVIDPAKFIIPSSGTMVDLHAKDKADIEPVYQELKKLEGNDFKVYLKKDVPAYLHYATADDRFNRIGDIILIPEWPKIFSKRKPGGGYHGFDTKVKNMQATFLAWGPNIKSGVQLPVFENVNVYPMVAELLKLKITEPVDGKASVLHPILH